MFIPIKRGNKIYKLSVVLTQLNRRRRGKFTKKALLVISFLVLSMILVCVPSFVHASDPAITRVQGPAQGTTTGGSISVNLAQAPQDGDVLIAVVGINLLGSNSPAPNPTISETGVNWTPSSDYQISNSGAYSYNCIQIWAAIVDSATVSTSITIDLNTQGTVTTSGATVDICEYSGLDTAYIQSHFCDQVNTNYGRGTTTDTLAAGPTTYANELWIGGTILLTSNTQSSPTDGFALLDGTPNSGISVGYLEKIVTSTGSAETGTTASGSGKWDAIVATFPAAPTVTLTPSSGQPGDVITISGSGFAVNSPITATFDGTALTLSGTATTDDTGSFTATFAVPATETPGSYTVNVADNQGTSASSTFVVPTLFVLPESSIGAASALIAFAAAFAVWITMMKKHSKKIG